MASKDFAALREKLKQDKLAQKMAKKEELKQKWEEEKKRRKECRIQVRPTSATDKTYCHCAFVEKNANCCVRVIPVHLDLW